MGFRALPVIPRTLRPAIAGTPVWYAEATEARPQLDVNITIPSGSARKLILLWGTDGGEFPTAVTFDPAGVAFPMVPIDGAFGEIGGLRIAAYYLDSPPTGAKTVRIATANAVWSAASLKVYQNARAGLPQAVTTDAAGTSLFETLDDNALLDSYSETADLILGLGLSDGSLAPAEGQVVGADDVINSSFLATTSDRTHGHSGAVEHGWTAVSSADLLMCALNVLFSTGQSAAQSATPLLQWDFDEIGATIFADAQGRSAASVVSSNVTSGHDPLFSSGGSSISMQATAIVAENHVDAQVPSWSVAIYLQPRAWPASSNDAIFAKDSGLPVPGGTQIEIETDGAIDWYIRDETGLAGTAIHVTSATGDGTLTLDVAHLLVATYDDDAKEAKLYHRAAGGSVTLLASKTDANFSGLENNTSVFSLFSRSGTSGNELDGIGDRVAFYAGVLTQAEVEALPAPVTIADPGAPSDLVMSNIVLGTLSPSTSTDVDPADFATGLGSGNRDLTELSDAAGRMSFLNDGAPTAEIRITTPAAPETTTDEQAQATIAEGGRLSNIFTISWRRQGTSIGDYTPFDFVTVSNPSLAHPSGFSGRPPFNASSPADARFIDPMSGIEMFRLGGDVGAAVMVDGSDSGLNYPHCLRQENLGGMRKTYNSDGTLLMIDQYFSRGGESSGDTSLCRSYLVDVTGSYTGTPWRIIRASSSIGLGDSGSNGNVSEYWVWDLLDPLRAYVFRSNGAVDEWFPVGAPGETVGRVRQVWGAVSGFDWWANSTRARLHTSWDGRYAMTGCRRISDGEYGGRRRDLINGDLGPFIPTTIPPSVSTDARRITAHGISPLGGYTRFVTGGNRYEIVDVLSGVKVSDTADVDSTGLSHEDWTIVNGTEYLLGCRTDTIRMFDIVAGTMHERSNVPGANPNHVCSSNWLDRFETYGSAGGGTSGGRYLIYARSRAKDGHPPAILGVRMGPNDSNQLRFICNHRTDRTDNANECHPQVSPDGRQVVFNSNWSEYTSLATNQIQPYVVLLPDAWWSPNNSGA